MRSLKYTVVGSGPEPLVCVHGWGCQGGQFLELGGLLEKSHRIYLPDLPGHGNTPLGDFVPGFENYAKALINFAIEHDLQFAPLIGHSMGGALSLMAAASGRIRPKAVINLDGSLPAAEKTLAGQAVVRQWIDGPDVRETLAAVLRETFFLPAERDERCEEIIRIMCASPASVLHFLPHHIGDLYPGEILPRITAPVLYVAAAAPRFDPFRAAELVKNFRLEHIEAGHFLHVYAPDQVAGLVEKFLCFGS